MINKYLIPFINDVAKSQGMAIAVLLVFTAWFTYTDYIARADQYRKIQALERRIEDCNEQQILLLQEERKELINVINEVSNVLVDISEK